jgi:hypothetical protein
MIIFDKSTVFYAMVYPNGRVDREVRWSSIRMVDLHHPVLVILRNPDDGTLQVYKDRFDLDWGARTVNDCEALINRVLEFQADEEPPAVVKSPRNPAAVSGGSHVGPGTFPSARGGWTT